MKTLGLFGVFALSLIHLHAGSIGDPAPALTVSQWLKGPPVRITPGQNIYVVEFWATWCGPCKRNIPVLNELQKKYAKDNVIIIGVSDEKADVAAPFVAAQGMNMNYRVGLDPSKQTFRSWMTAYGESGIPHCFVVDKQGRVAWHGMPESGLDRVLEEIIAGRFDIAQARSFEAGNRMLKQYATIVSASNAAAKAAPLGQKIIDDHGGDWRIPYRLAKTILTDAKVRSRDIELATRAANKAVELTGGRSYQALEMQARALFASGRKQEAIETQKKAIAACQDAEAMQELRKFLALFEKSPQTAAKR